MNKFLGFLVAVLAITTAYLYITQDKDAPVDVAQDEAVAEEIQQQEVPNEVVEDVVEEQTAVSAPVVSAPAPTPKKTAPSPPKYDADGNIIVRYTTYGFTPQTVEIDPGDAVRFINTNILPMWVKAQAHPTAEYFEYAALNQGRSSYQGEEYVFTFTQSGSWGYVNLNNEEHKGAVIVR